MSRKFLRLCLACGLALAMSGCGVVDKFSGSAVEYNRQVEQAQEKMLLLNVVRAMDRRPMAFSYVSQVSGQFQATSTSASVAVPFGPRPNAAGRSFTLNGGFQGGPNFTVMGLDTQEFYQGLMNPISAQMIDVYFKARYPREQIVDLTIHRIAIKGCSKGSPTITFVNYPSNPIKFDLFQTLAEYLIDTAGLTTEKVEGKTQLGPPLSGEYLSKHGEVIDRAGAAGLKIEKYEEPTEPLCPPRDETKKPNAAAAHHAAPPCTAPSNDEDCYAIVKAEESYGFCFKYLGSDEPGFCGETDRHRKTVQTGETLTEGASRTRGFRLNDPHAFLGKLAEVVDRDCVRLKGQLGESSRLYVKYCGYGQVAHCRDFDFVNPPGETGRVAQTPCYRYVLKLARALMDPKAPSTGLHRSISLTFYPRSTESLIYYLGEISRAYLAPEDGWPARVIKVHSTAGSEERAQNQWPCDVDGENKTQNAENNEDCLPLFQLETNSTTPSFLSVAYDGRTYSLPNDMRGAVSYASLSYPSLEVTKQLFAINLSAKALPATTVLSVVGVP
jgi:hypothetical protein